MNVNAIALSVIENVERVIVGKRLEVERLLIALLCRGHVLIEDVPGVGKTVLAKAIAKSLGCEFSRIQCTPDILPSDITGVSIFNQKTGEFEFRPGPVVAQIVLADEINRATPKTQAALLEAMEERQITVEGRTLALPEPFLVLATQNPIEYEGTFPLPEAQLDRFLIRLRLGYPSPADEMRVMDAQRQGHPIDRLAQVVRAGDLLAAQEAVQAVYIDELIKRYIVDIVSATREHADIYLGASPRGSLGLYRTSQARAALIGRDYVVPDDVKAMARDVLAHRIIVNPSARVRNVEAETLIDDIVGRLPVPGTTVRS
ncbi:AAA family ATPase [bacterium]|nr:MoxR family ATPase [Chloroflexi bacterium CFX6]RIL11856.1 MAG: AAA family ATPase [bacterium]